MQRRNFFQSESQKPYPERRGFFRIPLCFRLHRAKPLLPLNFFPPSHVNAVDWLFSFFWVLRAECMCVLFRSEISTTEISPRSHGLAGTHLVDSTSIAASRNKTLPTKVEAREKLAGWTAKYLRLQLSCFRYLGLACADSRPGKDPPSSR